MEDQRACSVARSPQFDTSIGRIDHDIDTVSKGSTRFGEFEWDTARHGIGPYCLFRFER
jgi:hypothetical protein